MAAGGRIMYRVFSVLFVALTVTAKTYYLLEHCNDNINVFDVGEVRLEITDSEYIPADTQDCYVYFSAPSNLQLSFHVGDIDLDDCFSGDQLQIFDESDTPSNAITSQLCKDEGLDFTTNGNLGLIKFDYNTVSASHRPASFIIYVNLYSSTGDCGDGFFHCQPKDMCMKDDLWCNDEDDCGDESDEKDCDEEIRWWVILIICIGVFVFVVIVLAAVCVCVASSNASKKKVGLVHTQGTAPLSTVAASAPQRNTWGFQGTPSVPPPSYSHTLTGNYGPTANQQGTGTPPPPYSSQTKDPLPPLTGVPNPAVYNLPLTQN